MRRMGYLGLTILLTLGLAAPAVSQAQAPAGPQAKTAAEYNAYKALYDEQNPQKKAELGEKFLTDYKESELAPQTYQLLINAYARGQNWAKVMETADRASAFPKADNKLKVYAYGNAMVAAQQANNFEKLVEYGEKVLSLDPNDLNAMIQLS